MNLNCLSSVPEALPTLPGRQPALKFSTQAIPINERGDWWREIICRHYANVDLISQPDELFQAETTILPFHSFQLSKIRSSAISIKKRPRDPERDDQDAYFAVVLLSGLYHLEQAGRIVNLQPGDMTLYDATRPHRIDCTGEFSKLIFAIPRHAMRSRLVMPEACTALRIPSSSGVGAVASNFLRTWAANIDQLGLQELTTICDSSLDLLSLAIATVSPGATRQPRGQSLSLTQIKAYIELNLSNPELNTAMIVDAVGLSPRYINALFAKEACSLMRYVLQRRLERCYQDILNSEQHGLRISDIAFRWGFNDLSHFSRTFKLRFELSPRDVKASSKMGAGLMTPEP
jgi:AraC family transcriptional activator of tynA and feaB